VDNRPLALASHPDCHRVHQSAAIRLPVTGLDVQVQADQAIGAVIAVLAAGPGRYDQPAAVFAGKAVRTGMCLIVSFFIPYLFIFTVHGPFSPHAIE